MEQKNSKKQNGNPSDLREIVEILKQQSIKLQKIEQNLKTNAIITSTATICSDVESPSSTQETILDLANLRICFDTEESHKEFCQNIKSIIESSETCDKFEGILNMLKMILTATLPEGEAEKYVKMLDLTSKAIGGKDDRVVRRVECSRIIQGTSKLNRVNPLTFRKWFRSTSNKEKKEENDES